MKYYYYIFILLFKILHIQTGSYNMHIGNHAIKALYGQCNLKSWF